MRVVVTKRLFPESDPFGEVVAEAGGEIEYADCATAAEAVEACRGADVVVGGFVPITEAAMEAAGDLEFVLVPAAGYDSVDLRAATARGIPVSNVPEYAPRDVAAHAFALALAAAHGVVPADRDLRDGPGWERAPLHPIHGGTFGVVGLGRIGRETVPMARGLDMDVIAADPHQPTDVFELTGVEAVGFEELLGRADCVSVHAPLTDVTHRLFSTAEFERMRESAVLVNTARGPIVDESALAAAVDAGEIRAAALDVFESEPPDDSPVLERERIVCSPHRASASPRARENMVAGAKAELRRALRGEPLRNVVNPSVLQYTGEQVTEPDG
jgi:D-3-phosphoglycerate dehydrogenase